MLSIRRKQNKMTYHAAPTTDKEMARPIPRSAHINGDVDSKNLQINRRKVVMYVHRMKWICSFRKDCFSVKLS